MAPPRTSPLFVALLPALLAAPSSGFGLGLGLGPVPSRTRPTAAAGFALGATRRDVLERSFAALSSALLPSAVLLPALAPLPAVAKDVPPPTRAEVTSAFAAVRSELESPSGAVAALSDLIDAGSFADAMQYTKEQDAYLRRGKMGKARKMLTDKNLKGEALQTSNAVTFDLIGINRASRPGKEDEGEQRRYWEELKKDIEKFLELEGTIVLEGE
ncbi:hypothetical protein ACHAWF_003139 [Thalassiosira exigua]